MEVTVHEEIWLFEKWHDVIGGYSLSQIVSSDGYMAEELTADGWTVTKYKLVKEEN